MACIGQSLFIYLPPSHSLKISERSPILFLSISRFPFPLVVVITSPLKLENPSKFIEIPKTPSKKTHHFPPRSLKSSFRFITFSIACPNHESSHKSTDSWEKREKQRDRKKFSWYMERIVGEKYKLGRKIGSGSFGEIFLGILFFLALFLIHIKTLSNLIYDFFPLLVLLCFSYSCWYGWNCRGKDSKSSVEFMSKFCFFCFLLSLWMF